TMVATFPTFGGGLGLGFVPLEPAVNVVVVVLLRPEEARAGLAGEVAFVGAKLRGEGRLIELVGFALSGGEDLIEVAKGRGVRFGAEADFDRRLAPGGDIEPH